MRYLRELLCCGKNQVVEVAETGSDHVLQDSCKRDKEMMATASRQAVIRYDKVGGLRVHSSFVNALPVARSKSKCLSRSSK